MTTTSARFPRSWRLLALLLLVVLPLLNLGRPVEAQSACVKTYVDTGSLQSFDFSQTRSKGHYELLETGLRVWTEDTSSQSKIAGYKAVDVALSEVVGVELTQTANSGNIRPAGQLVIDLDGDGTPNGIAVYEPWAYGNGNWWSNTPMGISSGLGYPTFGTLAQISAANPNARAMAYGFSLGSGVQGDWVIQSIQFITITSCTTLIFDLNPPPVITGCTEVNTARVTPINEQGFDYSETRATGHYEYQSTGLRIWTDGNASTDKVAGYVVVDYPLYATGEFAIEYIPTSGGRPGGQLRIDYTGDTAWDATLVYEPWAYGDGYWWSNKNIGVGTGGLGYPFFGTLNDILEVYPEARVKQVGFSLGSGVLGDGILQSITAGCVKYTFGLEQVEPQPPIVNPITACGTYGSIQLPTTTGVSYTATPPNATEGVVMVTAEAQPGFELINYAGPWTINLGTYVDCPLIPVQVVQPIVTVINGCGNYGSVQLPQIEGATYTAVPPMAQTGIVTVTVAAQPGYILENYNGPWVYDLGQYEECPQPPTQITAAAPVFVNTTSCTVAPRVSLPSSNLIDYTVSGQFRIGGIAVVTASLKPNAGNYLLVGQTRWTHVFTGPICTWMPMMLKGAGDSQ